jgi:hypothetical protein
MRKGVNMKKSCVLTLFFLLIFASSAYANFVSGSTGADGAFNPSSNTIVQLPPSGVFNYTTVNIPTGVTVTFRKNAANTPVYILATGDINIAGIIKVDGQSVVYSNPVNTTPGAGGPGGYDGGYGGGAAQPGGKGLGPGGGAGGPSSTYGVGGGGGFATAGVTYGTGHGAGGPVYGTARLIPLIGGSGGGGGAGSASASNNGGGGGGGAILIASSTTINITGSITVNGGDGYSYSGGGSGGGIRLISTTITGTGLISAKGGSSYAPGGKGRIRLEATTNTFTPGTNPQYTYGQPGSVFPASVPSLTITTIATVAVPASPIGSYAQPDVLLPNTTTNPVTVSISASNIPVGTTVAVTVTPQFGSSTSVNATLSGTNASSTASASVTLSTQYVNVVTAQATFTLLASLFYENEKIDRVRVATTMGKDSQAVYITESGREIPAEKLLAKMME